MLLCLSLSLLSGYAEQPKLQFTSGKFKIMQLTDIHWTEGRAECAQTIASIKDIVSKERPQIAILTGDIVTGTPALEGWHSVISIFEELKLPFTVTQGNHDAEFLSRDSIFSLLMSSPYYVGDKGPQNIFGMGNCVLPVYREKGGEVEALLYCIDSNDYLPTDRYGDYDWIHADQISWYRATSRAWTERNQGKPLPALAFFHIPLPEYRLMASDKAYLGSYKDEGIASPEINSGLFSAFIDCKDVMGVFVGHDHGNDFIGNHYGIALGYGRVSGWQAYGPFERGARIIELHEGERRFSSWVRTPSMMESVYHYPSGLTSLDEQSMAPYLPASKMPNRWRPRPGVHYSYYEGKCVSADSIGSLSLHSEGVLSEISIKNAKREDYFAYTFRARIHIPQSGVYRFYTYSDDGSKLYIDGQEIVDNDGGHGVRWASGKVGLEAGWHELFVPYFENYMGQELKIYVESKDLDMTLLPSSWLALVN